MYAHRRDTTDHARYKAWLDEVLGGEAAFGVSELVLSGFVRLCRDAGAKGNLGPDAYFAALSIESGCEWVSADRDYARFTGLRWTHPLAYDTAGPRYNLACHEPVRAYAPRAALLNVVVGEGDAFIDHTIDVGGAVAPSDPGCCSWCSSSLLRFRSPDHSGSRSSPDAHR